MKCLFASLRRLPIGNKVFLPAWLYVISLYICIIHLRRVHCSTQVISAPGCEYTWRPHQPRAQQTRFHIYTKAKVWHHQMRGQFHITANDLIYTVDRSKRWREDSVDAPPHRHPQFHTGLCTADHIFAGVCGNSNSDSAPPQPFRPQLCLSHQLKLLVILWRRRDQEKWWH